MSDHNDCCALAVVSWEGTAGAAARAGPAQAAGEWPGGSTAGSCHVVNVEGD